MHLIVDSHLDLAWNALLMNRDLTLPLADLNARETSNRDVAGRGHATTTLPEMRRGSVALCLGTLVAGASSAGGAARFTYSSVAIANSVAVGQWNYYQRLAAQGDVRLIATQSQLAAHVAEWQVANEVRRTTLPIGVIVAFEGCDSITAPDEADEWFARGIRCASLVHYGHGRYSGGTGTEAPLTQLGRNLLTEFDRLGVILDLTHLSDPAFEEVLMEFSGPVVASHQNCRAIVPRGRQFTDAQLQAVVKRGGVIGVACDNWMLSQDWPAQSAGGTRPPRESVQISVLVDQIDHICQIAGSVNHAAIGSDLDGGFGTEQAPYGLDSIADLQKLDAILSDRGYSPDDVAQILGGNWIRFFQEHLPDC